MASGAEKRKLVKGPLRPPPFSGSKPSSYTQPPAARGEVFVQQEEPLSPSPAGITQVVEVNSNLLPQPFVDPFGSPAPGRRS